MINYINQAAASPTAAQELIDTSLPLATGAWLLRGQTSGEVSYLVTGRPIGKWGETVDEIETPFASEYDEQEYQNMALQMLNLAELALVCSVCGVKPPWEAGFNARSLEGTEWLEAGCGTGRVALWACGMGAAVTAFDQTEAYVQEAATKMRSLPPDIDRPTLLVTPAETVDDSKRYDVITAMFGVPNHCENWPMVLKRLAGMLNENGKLIITMYGSPDAAVYDELSRGLSYTPAILTRRSSDGLLLGENAEKVLPARFSYPSDVTDVLQTSGLSVEKPIPFLVVTSLYPSDPTPENIASFLEVVERRFGKEVKAKLEQFKSNPAQLLVACLGADYEVPPSRVNEAAYFGVVAARKVVQTDET